MTRETVPGEKPLYWIGSSLKDIARFPSEVQRAVGFALSAAQYGGKHPSAKPWKGERPWILEAVKDHEGDTFRAIYTVRFSSGASGRCSTTPSATPSNRATFPPTRSTASSGPPPPSPRASTGPAPVGLV